MYNKAYILTFDKGGFLEGYDYANFHNLLVTAKGIVNWWHHLECTYILIVNDEITAKNITDYVLTIMPKKKFFVCELVLRNHNGWLDPNAWEWINQQINNQAS